MYGSHLSRQFTDDLVYLKTIHTVGRYGISGILPITNGDYKEYDIVISVTRERYDATDVHYPIDDIDDEDITKYFDDTYKLVSSMPDKKILIHCHEGKSRSATLLISILLNGMIEMYKNDPIMLDKNWTELLLKKIRESRSHAHPNKGFMQQLRWYEINLKSNI